MRNKIHQKKKRLKKIKIICSFIPQHEVCLINREFNIFIDKQIESARRIVSKKTLRISKLYIQLLSKIPATKKSKSSRMGKGKGKFDKFYFKLKPGHIIFKLFSSTRLISMDALSFAKKKLPSIGAYIY